MGILFLESFCVDFFADLCTGQGVKESIKDAFNDKVRISFAYLTIFGQFFKKATVSFGLHFCHFANCFYIFPSFV